MIRLRRIHPAQQGWMRTFVIRVDPVLYGSVRTGLAERWQNPTLGQTNMQEHRRRRGLLGARARSSVDRSAVPVSHWAGERPDQHPQQGRHERQRDED
jgi:hypothetical protein